MRYTLTLPVLLSGGAEIFTVAAWHKEIGDLVQPGDAVVTARASGGDDSPEITVPSPAYGILARKIVLPGEVIEVGEPLAILSGVPEPLTPAPGVTTIPDIFTAMPVPLPARPEEIVTLSPAARLLAQHNARSLRTSPHVFTVASADLGEVYRLRERVADGLHAREGVPLGLLPFVLSVVGAALEAHPALNAQLIEKTGAVRRKRYVALAFPLPTENGGVAVPVVRDPQRKSILGLAREIADLTERARAGALRPDEQRGATFTVAEAPGAADGIQYQTPILHQPQAGFLSLGAVTRAPVALDGDVVAVRPVLSLCLAHDARFVTGAEAAAFLAAVKRGLEEAQFLFA